MKKLLTFFILALMVLGASSAFAGSEKVVIAHRGASGYLPEHTLEAKAAAYFMEPNYIEQDLVMTKDDKLVVLHDHYLDRITNVMEKFPKRFRMVDGSKRWFAIDFTLAEIKSLKVTEGFKIVDGKKVQGYSARFPMFTSSFEVPTFEEELQLIQGLNKSTGKNIGIYPEIKAPWFHRAEGKDISVAALKTLKKYGYTSKEDKVYVQCFDPIETKRISKELLPKLGMDVKVVQLIAETSWNETMVLKNGKFIPYNYDWMFEKDGMKKVAEYADGIGPWKPMLVKSESTSDNLIITDMVKDAHANGMEVHPYTFRLDNGRIPQYAASYEDMLDIFFYTVDVDGVFTDFPDRAVKFLRRAEAQRQGL
ncbi:glycerophosphodiester phosphodiesterase [Halodesulfovibrio sp.]|jgi:glycerophosphoryl diester phosphodiesterase|uniref:glycerophosphodiester phosphodiesterase n=1 Tax=Halodesulfovibrio sp. TaxID=1912772 RepID=UPI0025F5FB00|nr:glycerophosphodiester phosphodiesterase [Halodesulfovibrio sp.]MCT4535292.1 glycerophosphodiester phosphodiesterase [Halodesulfovibrio sp.]MCT4627062.1 glycerophosphodiester phosphodiesterase [Halodesulfovibrio sp.]